MVMLTPVVSLSSSYYFLISPNHMPGNLKDFIAYVKKSPGKYNYGSAGGGSASHVWHSRPNHLALCGDLGAVHRGF